MFLQHPDKPESKTGSLILDEFTIPQIKALMQFATRVDIGDNNLKADIIRRYLEPFGFEEIGTGTNRIAFLKGGMVYKLALDRRGFVDDYCEFKRSLELPEYLAKTYETNMLINVCEYVTVLGQEQFIEMKPVILATLEDISKAYLFNDLGYILKNSMNWGCRHEDTDDAELCILDYGYFYPLAGQDLNKLFKCPMCGGHLSWNSTYTFFQCDTKACKYTEEPNRIHDRMVTDFEDQENQMLAEIAKVDVPDFINYEQYIADLADHIE